MHEDLYDQIARLFGDERCTRPEWVDEVLDGLQHLQDALERTKTSRSGQHAGHDTAFYAFVQAFRKRLQPDTQANAYPTYYYQTKRLGIDKRGLLYDKDTLRTLSTPEAYAVYRFAYNAERDHPESPVSSDLASDNHSEKKDPS